MHNMHHYIRNAFLGQNYVYYKRHFMVYNFR